MKDILKESMQKLDITIWVITLVFFMWSALVMWWDVSSSAYWAFWIVFLMFFIWLSIELILSALKNVKWLWTITGFITNWPEALVLIVWLIAWDVLFAASTPLWSNVMNPILLILWIFVTWMFLKVKEFKYKTFFFSSFVVTAILAIVFFKVPESFYLVWIFLSLLISIYLFTRKFVDIHEEVQDETQVNKLFLPLWIVILLVSWYFLDPIVSFTAEASMAPKWLIWFLVLATLTSWPEFKSVLWLLKRNKVMDSFMNILVSNITNLWLAVIWVLVWMFIR